ncbi:fibronectin type III domain-containing protein [Enterococcus gallinarum]|uniref:fibronectin type III domain-containing protein n=1 Tax=Enterococcus gallinarum TaxID=1353 RepID=UPI001D17CF08|nr:fibronectin type III domain-containing protein [Enterococcus gallinarum]MCC4043754.1 fibronectin type III domain-containing protein [Enterococcus gallinarum]
MVCLKTPSLRPNAPRNVTGEIKEDGSISLSWDAVEGAQSYVLHYGNANQSEPIQAVNMGYSETNSWTLATGDVPELAAGDKIYLYVQTYREKGVGITDVEKARYLHDGDFVGSAWSEPIILEKG